MRLLDGPAEGAVEVTVISLEMTDPAQLVGAAAPAGARWEEVCAPVDARARLSRDLYRRVGADWHWVDRREWSQRQWRDWVDRPQHHLLVCRREDALAGYAEVEEQQGGDVEIAYFGLLPECLGRGMGTWWLSEVIAFAWQRQDTRRVWVHTCTLDSPAALRTYHSRGMRECARAIEWRLPER